MGTMPPVDAATYRRAYRPAEIARMLGTGRSTVGRWIEQGRLPAVRVGRALFVPADDLERFLERYRVPRSEQS
jgi:excisionase family DNA binding protein